eukprot:s4_g7.t1
MQETFGSKRPQSDKAIFSDLLFYLCFRGTGPFLLCLKPSSIAAMSFFEPRLKPLPDAFYSECDASPVRSKVLRRIPTWPGYVPYKLLEPVDGQSEADEASICDPQEPPPIWPSTEDELETDVGQILQHCAVRKQQKLTPGRLTQRFPCRPSFKPGKLSPRNKRHLPRCRSIWKLRSRHRHPMVSLPPLPCCPLNIVHSADHSLDDCSSLNFPSEKVQPSFSCVSHGGVLNSYVYPQYTTQHHMLQPKQSEIKAANHEASKKAAALSSRNGHHGHEKHGTPSSKNVGLQQPQGTDAPKAVPVANEQTKKAMLVGDAAKKKARAIGEERAKEKAMERPMMPAVDHMKPRGPHHGAPAAYGRANGFRGRK